MVPKITDCTFKVGPKRKGKRPIWCNHDNGVQVITGFSETSVELAYRDFRKQWTAFTERNVRDGMVIGHRRI